MGRACDMWLPPKPPWCDLAGSATWGPRAMARRDWPQKLESKNTWEESQCWEALVSSLSHCAPLNIRSVPKANTGWNQDGGDVGKMSNLALELFSTLILLGLPYFTHMLNFFFFFKYLSINKIKASQVVLVVKSLPANAGDVKDVGLIPGLRKSCGGGNVNPL